MKTPDLYSELGLPRSASANDVKKAYRKKAKEAHPDKGGSGKAWHRLQLAYDILSDEERRKRYDETGDLGSRLPEDNAFATLAAALQKAIEHCREPEFEDLLAEARVSLLNREKQICETIAKHKAAAEKLRRIAERIGCTSENSLRAMVEGYAANHEQAARAGEGELELTQRAFELSQAYSYKTEERPPEPEFKPVSFEPLRWTLG